MIYLLVRCINRVSLPNIISDKLIVPELLMADVNVNKISYEIERLLYDNERRAEQISELGEVKNLLSEKVSSYEAAKALSNVL